MTNKTSLWTEGICERDCAPESENTGQTASKPPSVQLVLKQDLGTRCWQPKVLQEISLGPQQQFLPNWKGRIVEILKRCFQNETPRPQEWKMRGSVWKLGEL